MPGRGPGHPRELRAARIACNTAPSDDPCIIRPAAFTADARCGCCGVALGWGDWAVWLAGGLCCEDIWFTSEAWDCESGAKAFEAVQAATKKSPAMRQAETNAPLIEFPEARGFASLKRRVNLRFITGLRRRSAQGPFFRQCLVVRIAGLFSTPPTPEAGEELKTWLGCLKLWRAEGGRFVGWFVKLKRSETLVRRAVPDLRL